MKNLLLLTQTLLLSQTSALKSLVQTSTNALQSSGSYIIDLNCQYYDASLMLTTAQYGIQKLKDAFAEKDRASFQRNNYYSVFLNIHYLTIEGLAATLDPCVLSDETEQQEALAKVQEFHALLDSIYPDQIQPYQPTGTGSDTYNSFFTTYASQISVLESLRIFVANIEDYTYGDLVDICGEDLSTCSDALYNLGDKSYYVMMQVKQIEYYASSSLGGSTKEITLKNSMQAFVDLWMPYMRFLLVSYRDVLYAFAYKAMSTKEYALTTTELATITAIYDKLNYRIFTDWRFQHYSCSDYQLVDVEEFIDDSVCIQGLSPSYFIKGVFIGAGDNVSDIKAILLGRGGWMEYSDTQTVSSWTEASGSGDTAVPAQMSCATYQGIYGFCTGSSEGYQGITSLSCSSTLWPSLKESVTSLVALNNSNQWHLCADGYFGVGFQKTGEGDGINSLSLECRRYRY